MKIYLCIFFIFLQLHVPIAFQIERHISLQLVYIWYLTRVLSFAVAL